MATNVIKCTGCNLVISEVLTFVKNKLDVMDEESLSRICVTAFTSEEILSAKKLLYDSIPTVKRIKIRKGDRKTQRDIDDIITLLKQTDPDFLPVFVARDLQKLPPITFDHVDVTRLLKDILILKDDLKTLQERYITVDTFQMLKQEVDDLKISSNKIYDDNQSVNTKKGNYQRRGSNYDSGPMELQHISGCSPNNSVTSIISPGQPLESPVHSNSYQQIIAPTVSHNNEQSDVDNSVGASIQRMSNQMISVTASVTNDAIALQSTAQANPPVARSDCAHAKTPMLHDDLCTVQLESRMCTQEFNTTIADKLKAPGQWKPENPSEKWEVVQKRRIRNRIAGKVGTAVTETNGTFKAADIRIPLFIYNVDKSTVENDIITHVLNKTKLRVSLQKLNVKFDRGYDAYKMLVPKNKLDYFLNEHFWPEGVQFRRFVNFTKSRLENNEDRCVNQDKQNNG